MPDPRKYQLKELGLDFYRELSLLLYHLSTTATTISVSFATSTRNSYRSEMDNGGQVPKQSGRRKTLNSIDNIKINKVTYLGIRRKC
eukprot:2764278-Rhodomonas_salina.2